MASSTERLLAWLITGPIGHFVAGAIDFTVALARIAWARALRRRS